MGQAIAVLIAVGPLHQKNDCGDCESAAQRISMESPQRKYLLKRALYLIVSFILFVGGFYLSRQPDVGLTLNLFGMLLMGVGAIIGGKSAKL